MREKNFTFLFPETLWS